MELAYHIQKVGQEVFSQELATS